MKKYDVVIIGSGIGGLSTALMLSQKGKRVLVLEKNNIPGGRLSAFKKKGFNIDLGVHIMSRSEKGPIGEVLNRCGLSCDIKFNKVRPVSSYNSRTFVFPHDLKNMVPAKDFESIICFLNDIKEMKEEEISKYDDICVKEFLAKYSLDEFIHSCVSMISTVYLCLPSWEASAGEFMRCMKWEAKARASGYPEGGCGTIVRKFVEGINNFGGEFLFNSQVNKIVVNNNHVKGIETNNEFIGSETVVANTDIKAVVKTLVGDEYFTDDYIQYVERLKYSWSGLVVKLALKNKITDIKMLSQFGSLNQENYYSEIKKGHIPEEVNLFLVVPSNFSDNIAPAGKQFVTFTAPMPLDIDSVTENNFEETMINTVEKYIPDLRENILFKEKLTIKALDRYAGMAGAGIGIGQVPFQVGSNRPSIKLPIDGLYVVGASAGGAGVGVELAINSAIEFVDKYYLSNS